MTGMRNKRGFTLIEVIVAVAIFVSVVVVATLALAYAVRAQRYNLAHEELINQTSFVVEHMSRSLRMAKKQLPGLPSCIGLNENYEQGANSITFLHYKDKRGATDDEFETTLVCTKFYLSDGRLYEENVDTLESFALTSESLEVTDFSVSISLDQQKLVGIFLEITGRENTIIRIQTSISQRDLNI